MKKDKKIFNTRLGVVFVLIITIGLILIVNLFYIQIKNGNRFREIADDQYVVATYNSFERGNIFFEEKDGSRITVAGQKKGYKISVNPSLLNDKDKELIFNEINSILSLKLNKDRYLYLVNDKRKKYVEIVHNLSQEDVRKIKDRLGKKINIHSEKWRVYPLKKSSSHVIGFLGFGSDNSFAGRYGLERYYEKTLRRNDVDLYTNFFARAFHDIHNLIESDIDNEGDIIGTIEPQVQLFFEKELSKVQETWNSELTAGVIMNPRNGEIYAMAVVPGFDNNNFKKESLSVFKNPVVESVYEFGSVIKPLVVAIGIDKNIISANTDYYDKGSVVVEDYTISNFDKKGRGWVNVQDILNQSLNTGMVFISKKIPKDIFRDYFVRYGFTNKSGIDLPNDVLGLTSNLRSNRDIEFANMSFGQGIAISPITFIKALSILANKGKDVHPHIVKKIEYTNGLSKEIFYSNINTENILSEETAFEVSRMLVNVFDNYRHGNAKIPQYSIAAKTGTAQIPAPDGGYYHDRNLHSFFGYFPAYDPKFIIFMYTVYPKNIKYASQTLLDPFRDVTKYLINYYNIPPDR